MFSLSLTAVYIQRNRKMSGKGFLTYVCLPNVSTDISCVYMLPQHK